MLWMVGSCRKEVVEGRLASSSREVRVGRRERNKTNSVGLKGQSSNDSSQGNEIGESDSRLLESKEQRRPGEVESQRDPVKVEGVDSGGSGSRVDGSVARWRKRVVKGSGSDGRG